MRTLHVSILFITMILVFFTQETQADTFAWIIDNSQNKAHKFNIDKNEMIQVVSIDDFQPSLALSFVEKAVIPEADAGLLFLIYDTTLRLPEQRIRVYDLKSFTLKKDLGIISSDPSLLLPYVIAPPTGNRFFVFWWDQQKQAQIGDGKTNSVFNKNNLEKIEDLPEFPINFHLKNWYSSDGNKLYSITYPGNEIKIVDINTLTLAETVRTDSFWSDKCIGTAFKFATGDNVLLAEDVKKSESEPVQHNYFTFNLLTRKISNKINIAEIGYGILSSKISRIAILEVSLIDRKSTNKVHIYSIVTGEKLGVIDLSKKYTDIKKLNIDTISPDGTKLYLTGRSIETQKYAFIVVSLKYPYSIVAQFPDIAAEWFVITGEETNN